MPTLHPSERPAPLRLTYLPPLTQSRPPRRRVGWVVAALAVLALLVAYPLLLRPMMPWGNPAADQPREGEMMDAPELRMGIQR